jgi:hypothetical protein
MKIYTGTCSGEEKLANIAKYDLGFMVSPSPARPPRKSDNKVDCALDNGAFRNWQLGYPFMEGLFMETLRKCRNHTIKLDFIVCPDIVTAGRQSLEFSMEWATGKLKTAQNLALAVQDGIVPQDVSKHLLDNFTHIFVGGTVDWKWETAEQWVEYAHSKGLKCHIGRCGTLEKLRLAKSIGADSVDSTSIARNDRWDIIDELNKDSMGLFK